MEGNSRIGRYITLLALLEAPSILRRKIILPFFNLGVSWKVATVLVRDAIWEAVDGRMKLVDKEVEERTAIQDIVSFGPRKYANYIQ